MKMNADDGFAGRLRLEEALVIARLFADAGVDAIIPSYGFTSLNPSNDAVHLGRFCVQFAHFCKFADFDALCKRDSVRTD